MKIYLAGPIAGKSYDEIVSSYRIKISHLSYMGYSVLCPMTGKNSIRDEERINSIGYQEYPVATSHAIFERDKWMVQSSDIVFADLTTANRVSIGTVMELAWASMLGKHTVVVMQRNNIHRHLFVLEAADIVFDTLDEAYYYFEELIGKQNG